MMTMEERELSEVVDQQHYFEAVHAPSPEEDEGTREIGPLYPFLISGGKNTERYYFTHINDITDYKFTIIPKYFGNEASYPEIFPARIKDIIKNNVGAKVFCVFDLDTVFRNKTNKERHKAFEENIQDEIDKGIVVLCPSMPSIEYWFLLHFENYTDLITSCGRKIQTLLSPYMMPYFPESKKKLLNLLKSEEYVNKPEWVEKLCADGKLDSAIERAEANIAAAETNGNLNNHSYSYVYKVFKM